MKKRRGSVLCRCTTYIRQPGSLRDSSVSLPKTWATSFSRPAFAIQVTANTTIRSLRQVRRLGCRVAARCFQFCQELIHKHRVVAIRSGRNHAHARTALLLEERKILASLFGEFIHRGAALSGSPPARQVAIHTLEFLPATVLRRNFVGRLAVDFVTHADRNLWQFIEHVELGNHQPGDAVNHASVTKKWQIHPAAAAWTAGDSAEFVPALAQFLTTGIVGFGGEWTTADAGAVGFRHANDHVDVRRSNAGADHGPAGGRTRRSDEGIGAVVDVEHRALRAFKDNRLALF